MQKQPDFSINYRDLIHILRLCVSCMGLITCPKESKATTALGVSHNPGKEVPEYFPIRKVSLAKLGVSQPIHIFYYKDYTIVINLIKSNLYYL